MSHLIGNQLSHDNQVDKTNLEWPFMHVVTDQNEHSNQN